MKNEQIVGQIRRSRRSLVFTCGSECRMLCFLPSV